MKFGINKKEIAPALLMLFIGMATVLGSLNYKIGSLARMGPGYFPLLLGAGLMLVALLIALSPPESEDAESATVFVPQYRAWSLVIGAIVLFVVLGHYAGLVPATFSLAFVAALADTKNSIKTAFTVAVVLTAMAVAVFHYGLQMQFPLLRWN